MRFTVAFVLLASTICFLPQPAAALKKIPYPEVKVEAPEPFKPDAGLDAMRKSLAAIVEKKDAKALFALVSPDFTWTTDGDSAEQYDKSRDALQNFKVAFGFRAYGKNEDIPSDQAFWILLEDALADPSLTPHDDHLEIACGPATVELTDDAIDHASELLADKDEDVEWVYTLKEITLTEKPTGGAAVVKVSNVALPVVSHYPSPKNGETMPVSFYEVLLPSGKTGWIDADGVDPLATDRICFGKDKSGTWKITGYEQNS